MTGSHPAIRRLLLLALAVGVGVAVGVAAWWLFRDPAASPGVGGGIDRSDEVPATIDVDFSPPPAADPVLQGTGREAPPPASPEPAEPLPKTWVLTFEVRDHDGTPRHWTGAGIHTRDGAILADAEAAKGDNTRGRVEVPGSGLVLVVGSPQRLPWVSELLEAPPSGERHLVVRLEAGLRVAGVVYEQDGVTPHAGGMVHARVPAQADPYRPPLTSLQGMVGPDGKFAIEGLPPGRVTLRTVTYDRTKGRPVRAEVDVGDENVRLVLGPQGAIAVLVVDEATGLSPTTRECRVYVVTKDGDQLWSHWGSLRPEEKRAAKPTSYRLASPGDVVRYRVRALGYEPSDIVTAVVPETGGKQIVRVELRRAPGTEATLRIRVRTEDGRVPARVPVTHHLGQGSSNTTHRRVVDDRITEPLMPGAHHLTVGRKHRLDASEGEVFWLPVDLRLDLAPGEQRDVDVYLARGGWAVIEGDPDPRPRAVTLTRGDEVVKRSVWWGPWGKEHRTGYHLGPIPEGTWTLEYVERGKGRRTTFDIQKDQILVLDPKTFEPFTK